MRVIAILPLLPVNALALTLPRASTSVGDELGPHVSDDTLKVPEVRDIIDIAEVPGSSAGSVALQNAGQFLDFDAPKPSSCQAQKAKLAAVQVNTGGEKANTIPTPSPATNSSSVGASSQATPTSNAAPTSGASGTEGSVTAWLDAHNVARAEYGAAAVTWDDGLSQRAQANAVLCTHGHTNSGENIAWGAPSGMTEQDVVNMWMAEAPQYTGNYSDAAGHFSQVVWNATTSIGCYTAKCSGGSQQATCEYNPAGNVIGDNDQYLKDNVFPKGTKVQ